MSEVLHIFLLLILLTNKTFDSSTCMVSGALMFVYSQTIFITMLVMLVRFYPDLFEMCTFLYNNTNTYLPL